jgi:uncharacterized iron-regulated protein
MPSPWDSAEPYPLKPGPRLGDIVHTATGHLLTERQLLDNLVQFPLVYVGEVHDNPASHRLQLLIIKAMHANNPGKVVLGMEMFNSGQQQALDQWVSGELNEKDFLRESRWFSNWAADYELYQELLEFCRQQQIPVIGLNVTKALGRQVSMTPLDQLDSETRTKLPEMDMSDPYQRAMIEKIFEVHGAGSKMVDSFFRRQTLWDESMARGVADYMGQNPEHQMMVVAGGWHVRYGFGIPRRVHRRLPIPYALVGEYHLEIPAEKEDQLMDVTMPSFPMRAVDYLVYLEYEVFKAKGVTLGVMLDDSDDEVGIGITGVSPGSAAEQAGIEKGDRILSFDGNTLADSFDLIYATRSKRAGDSATIELLRGELKQTLEVKFTPHPDKHP